MTERTNEFRLERSEVQGADSEACDADEDASTQPSEAVDEDARRSDRRFGTGAEITVVASASKAGRERSGGTRIGAAVDEDASDAQTSEGGDRHSFSTAGAVLKTPWTMARDLACRDVRSL